MKKLLSLGLGLLLICGCTSAATGSQSPYELYSEALSRVQNETKMEMNMTSSISMAMNEETVDMVMDINMKMDQSDQANPVLAMTMDMDMLGETIGMAAYYQDGMYYMDMLGEKMAVEMPFDEALGQVEDMSSDTEEFTEADFEGAEYTEQNGNHVISLKMSQETIDELTAQALEQASLSDVGDASIEYGDIVSTITIDSNGDLVSTDLQMPMTFTIDGQTLTMDMGVKVDYVAFGDQVVIEMPDFSDYTQY